MLVTSRRLVRARASSWLTDVSFSIRFLTSWARVLKSLPLSSVWVDNAKQVRVENHSACVASDMEKWGTQKRMCNTDLIFNIYHPGKVTCVVNPWEKALYHGLAQGASRLQSFQTEWGLTVTMAQRTHRYRWSWINIYIQLEVSQRYPTVNARLLSVTPMQTVLTHGSHCGHEL